MIRCTSCRIVFLILTLLATSSNMRADDLDNIVFEGVVRDNTGAVLPAARVIAVHIATGVERYCLSGDEGRYRISVSAPGNYIIKVVAAGFNPEQSDEITATTGRAFSIDFTLAPSGVTEQVTVAASSTPLVDTTRTVVGDTITRRELDELPIINRDPLQLVFLLGGAAEAPLSTSELADEGRGRFLRGTPEEAGIFSLTGAPATSNNITIDGLDNNDDRAARERITLTPESIAEVQIITNQYAAEYGRASGGRINIRTRGGSNRYNADGYFYFGDESLKRKYFFTQRSRTGPRAATTAQGRRSRFRPDSQTKRFFSGKL